MPNKTYRRKSIHKRNKRSKRSKRIRTLKKSHRKIKGGVIEDISVKSILITDPIFKAIKELNPEFKPTGFKKEPGQQGFTLHKLNQSQNLSKPISVIKYTKYPGYYSIVDGRHRFAKLVARGNNTIKADVSES
jgi:hypothetical protein